MKFVNGLPTTGADRAMTSARTELEMDFGIMFKENVVERPAHVVPLGDISIGLTGGPVGEPSITFSVAGPSAGMLSLAETSIGGAMDDASVAEHPTIDPSLHDVLSVAESTTQH